MALSLVSMVKYNKIDADAAYFVAFVQIGMSCAKYLVAFVHSWQALRSTKKLMLLIN